MSGIIWKPSPQTLAMLALGIPVGLNIYDLPRGHILRWYNNLGLIYLIP